MLVANQHLEAPTTSSLLWMPQQLRKKPFLLAKWRSAQHSNIGYLALLYIAAHDYDLNAYGQQIFVVVEGHC